MILVDTSVLIDYLEGIPNNTDDWQHAWRKEAQQRMTDFEQGTLSGIAAETLFAELEARYT